MKKILVILSNYDLQLVLVLFSHYAFRAARGKHAATNSRHSGYSVKGMPLSTPRTGWETDILSVP